MRSVLFALTVTWDPTIRGILVVLTGVLVMMGSTYVILYTNLGSRLGFLVAAAGFFGWMSIMGIAWWVYGIGLIGDTPAWRITEVVTSDTPDDLASAQLEEARDLSDWTELVAGDTARGDAEAAASDALTNEESRIASFESTTEFVVIDAFDKGGKGDGLLDRLPGPHPPHHAIVQVRQAVPQTVLAEGETCPEGDNCYSFGETPPPAEADESAPVLSVIMVRDIGSRRLPPALITLGSILLFGLTCNVLHRRDKAVMQARALAEREA